MSYGARSLECLVMSYGGPAPQMLGYVLPILTEARRPPSCKDGGIYSSSLTVGYAIPIRTAAAGPKTENSPGLLPPKLKIRRGLLPPIFGGVNLHPPYLNFGPVGIAPGLDIRAPLLLPRVRRANFFLRR